MKKKIILVILSSILMISSICLYIYKNNKVNKYKTTAYDITLNLANKIKTKDIKKHYNKFVKTSRITKIYKIDKKKYKESGYLGPNVELELEDIKIQSNTLFFKIKSLDEDYYVSYESVKKIDSLHEFDKRYEKYVPFEQNIITNDKVSFYDEKNLLVYTFNKSYNLPIYIKNDDNYEVVFNNRLLKVKKSDVKEVLQSHNSDLIKETEVPTILYHFIYDSDKEKCNEIICQSLKQVQQHINYLKENNYFTLTMEEFEKFVDGKLNVVNNSILITIDDGGFAYNAKKIFTENKINATLFVVSSWFDPHEFESDYLEVHSHGHNLHNTGVCPTGQGGGIQCLDRNILLEDLRISREKTNNTIAFSYPFYEYNNYSISILKEAGFRLGFAGLYAGGGYKTTVGHNKFEIPRITILNDTSVDDLKQAIS